MKKTRTEDEGVDIESMNRQRVWEKEDESETFFLEVRKMLINGMK